MNNEELLEVFDESGSLRGLFPRSDCHKNKELAHRAVHVLVFNPEGALILQKRSAKKDLYPLMWDTSVGGHLMSGETYKEAAIRECEEELGFVPEKLYYLYGYRMEADNETELVETFFTIYDGVLGSFNDEVADAKPFLLPQLFLEAEKFCSPFFLRELQELKKFLKERGIFYEGVNNWWRGDAWQRFIAGFEERKD